MKNYSVKQYERNDYKHWNAFVCDAKNATFLFHRHFMEYHGNLFSNHLLIVLKNEKWVAVIPANTVNDVLHSHQEQTYGRFVLSEKINLRTAIGIFKKGMNYLKESQIATFQLKLIPSFYCDYFSDETAYLLFLIQAKLWRRDCVTLIDLKKPFEFFKERKQFITIVQDYYEIETENVALRDDLLI